MSKYDNYKDAIWALLDAGSLKQTTQYITDNSNLPGPRGNLEMSYAFGDYYARHDVTEEHWRFLWELTDIGCNEAPVNAPKEMLPFCGTLAMGSLYFYVDSEKQTAIRARIQNAMNDERWRMRESAAMAMQRMAEVDFTAVKDIIVSMYSASNFMEKRAFVAALAHPPVLKDKANAVFSLKLSEDMLRDIVLLDDAQRKTEGFKVLSKGLQYAISVFAAHAPDEGFDMMKRYAAVDNKDIRRILKENLKKARLKKKYASETEAVLSILDS